MPGRLTRLALVALLVAGCSGGSAVFVPTDFADTTKTAVFVTHDPLALVVLDVSESKVTRFDGLDEDTPIHLLEYEASVEALQLVTGLLELVSLRDGRPFPTPMSIRNGTVGGLGVEGWRSLAALPPDLADAAIEPIDGTRCIEAGGCLADLEAVTCAIPCPAEVDVQPPRAPIRPTAVEPIVPSCRVDWTIESVDGVDRCVPPPDVGPCAAYEAQHVGEASCARVGSACPVDDWEDDVAPGRDVVYVRTGAIGGTGSRTTPFGTIAEAVAEAPVGAVVALAKGRYDEPGDLRSDVAIVGACVEQTVWSASSFRTSSDATVTLENLTLEGRLVARATHTVVRRAVLDGGEDAAFLADIGRLELIDVVARGTSPYVGSGQSQGELVGSRVVVDAAGADGLVMYGSRTEIDALRIRGTTERGVATIGGSMRLSGVVAPPSETGGIGALGGAEVDVEDAYVGGTQIEVGVVVTAGSTLTLSRAALIGVRDGIRVTGARLEAVDLLIEDSEYNGIVSFGGHVIVHRARVRRTGDTGLGLYRATTATVTDVVYEGRGGAIAYGISAGEGTRLRFDRGTFAIGPGSAIAAFGEGAVVEANDLTMRDVGVDEARDLDGIIATFHSGATVTLTRIDITDCRRIYFEYAASVTITDITTRCDAPRAGEPVAAIDGFGAPLFVYAARIEGHFDRAIRQSNAVAELTDIDIEGVVNGGVVVDAAVVDVERLRSNSTGGPAFDFTDATLTAKDVEVRTLRLAGELCADACRGIATRLHTRANPDSIMARAMIRDFVFSGGDGAAIEECGGSPIHLSNGRVDAFEAAALVCSDPFDESGLLDRVEYTNIERFVDYVQ